MFGSISSYSKIRTERTAWAIKVLKLTYMDAYEMFRLHNETTCCQFCESTATDGNFSNVDATVEIM